MIRRFAHAVPKEPPVNYLEAHIAAMLDTWLIVQRGKPWHEPLQAGFAYELLQVVHYVMFL